MVTGYNVPPGTPNIHSYFADNEDGYMLCMTLNRCNLYGCYFDLVQSLRYGAISEQDYQRSTRDVVHYWYG